MDISQQEKLDTWTKETLESAVEALLDVGITESALVEAKPAWVLPFQLLVGKVREQSDETGFWWFITGDCPTDHVDSSVATSPREAARYFALRWQIRASNEAEAGSQLVEQAQSLYELTEDDRLWSVE